jgi:hypothetical protein
MTDGTVAGLPRARLQGLAFLGGLALLVVGVGLAGRLGGADVLVRLAGYAVAGYALLSYVRDRTWLPG